MLQWSKHTVSFFGPAYVSKQSLQSQLVHLLSFDALTTGQLAKLNTLIYGYISRNRYNTDPIAGPCMACAGFLGHFAWGFSRGCCGTCIH